MSSSERETPVSMKESECCIFNDSRTFFTLNKLSENDINKHAFKSQGAVSNNTVELSVFSRSR